MSRHSRSLQSKRHDCAEMQADYNIYGLEQFTFHVLLFGSEWADAEKRKEKETEILRSYPQNQLYNVHPEATKQSSKNYRVCCEIHGKVYNSIAEAARDLQIAETKICQNLKYNLSGYKILEKVECGSTPVIIEDVEYDSLVAVVEADLAKDRFQVGRRLKSMHKK